MTFYLIGIDYRNSRSGALKDAHRRRTEIIEYWRGISPGRVEALFTCNRVEVYGTAGTVCAARDLADRFKRAFPASFSDAYAFFGREAVYRHGLRLACGLESQLKGECQIVKQLEDWIADENFPKPLFAFWEDIVMTACAIRKDAGLDNNAVNVADLIFDDLAGRIGNKPRISVMVIGTGKVAGLVAQRRPSWARLAFVAGKRRIKALELAKKAKGDALFPEEMPERLKSVDAVILATSSPHYVLTGRHFDKARKTRTEPLYIYDLSTEGDVAPEVADIGFNEVLDYDLLVENAVIDDDYMKRIDHAAQLAEEAVSERGVQDEPSPSWLIRADGNRRVYEGGAG